MTISEPEAPVRDVMRPTSRTYGRDKLGHPKSRTALAEQLEQEVNFGFIEVIAKTDGLTLIQKGNATGYASFALLFWEQVMKVMHLSHGVVACDTAAEIFTLNREPLPRDV